jgi:hypothetical protein
VRDVGVDEIARDTRIFLPVCDCLGNNGGDTSLAAELLINFIRLGLCGWNM